MYDKGIGVNDNFDQILNLAKQILDFLKLPFFTFLGAFTLYVLHRLQDRQPFSLFTALNIDVSKTAPPANVFGDMILSSLIDAVVVCALTEPTTIPQAVVAGLGMTGILSAHAKSTEG